MVGQLYISHMLYQLGNNLPNFQNHLKRNATQVNLNEGLLSKFRSKLNRFAMSTKGYTKSVNMLKHLLAIVFEECLNQSIKSISAAG